MQITRFVVSAMFAWMLIRATFANTVTLRHPPAFAVDHGQRHAPAKNVAIASGQR